MANGKRIMKEYQKITLIFVVQMMLLTTFIINNFSTKHIYAPSKVQKIVEMSMGMVILIFSFLSIFIVKKLYKTAQEHHFNRINELKYAHIAEQNKIYQEIKHDLNNHLTLLSVLASESRYVELENYLSHYQAEIRNVSVHIDTGLHEMDVLLYSKIATAHSKNITTKFANLAVVNCKPRFTINLISIVGNLLDNAIEASIETEDKTMSIYIKEDPVDYIFIIRNSFANLAVKPLELLGENVVSTKGLGRGKGLYIVKKLVAKFEGKVVLQVCDGHFEARVELPKHKLV